MASADRLSVVLRAMADASPDGAVSLVDRVCLAGVKLLSLQGAGVSLMVEGQLRGTAGVSEAGIAAIQELQLELGEGPCVEAWSSAQPVLESDLDDRGARRWPAFAREALAAGVRAMFAFPLRIGAIRIGVLVLYRDRPGALDGEDLATGLLLADVATQVILGLQAGAPTQLLHDLLAREPAHWAEIHQATGMVALQLEVPLDEAFVRLRAHAFACDLPLRQVAREVVARRLRLEEAA
jgi:hypothetical protein